MSSSSIDYNLIDSGQASINSSSLNDFWNTSEGVIRNKIIKMTQQKQKVSYIYKDTLRSILSEFSDIVIFKDEESIQEIRVIHANQERAVAKLQQEDNIILPIISIAQLISQNDDNRIRYKSLLIKETVWDSEKSRAIRVLSLAPKAVNINYDINVWAKYKSDLDQISEQIRTKFNPDLDIYVSPNRISKAYLDEEADVGSVTAVDKEERLLQKKFSLVVKTYIDSPKFLVTNTGKIEEFNVESYLS